MSAPVFVALSPIMIVYAKPQARRMGLTAKHKLFT
jgi:hypothetical protein